MLPKNEEHRNDLYVVALEGTEQRWYAKRMPNPETAVKNLLSAELYRLVCGSPHPKTLVAKDQENGWFSLSEDFSASHTIANTDLLLSNAGFADVLIVSLWLHEIDLRLPNLLVHRETGEVAKIDAEVSFHSLFYPEHEHEITSETLDKLPLPHRYPTYNWLSHVEKNNFFKLREFDSPITLSEEFEKDKHRSLLRICLIPDFFIVSLCKTILFGAEEESFAQFLIERRDQIRASAMCGESFCSYLASEEAKSEASAFLSTLAQFTTQRARVISDAKQSWLSDEYMLYCRQLGLVFSLSVDKENLLQTYSIFSRDTLSAAVAEDDNVLKPKMFSSSGGLKFFKGLERLGCVHEGGATAHVDSHTERF